MSKILAFVKLDLITIKPYLTIKNLIVFTALAFIMVFSTGTSGSAIGILMVLGALYVSYPFAVGEKNGIDALYATLPLSRGTVVLGRYLFALLVNICAGLLAIILPLAVMLAMQKDINVREALIITSVVFIIFSVLQAFQLPIYFKLGYAKAKFATYVPFVGFPLVVLGFTTLLKNIGIAPPTFILEWFGANPAIAFLLGAAVWFAIMVVSYKLSLAFYRKRDF